MKTLNKVFVLLLFAFALGCSSDDSPQPGGDGPDNTSEYEMVDVQVILPQNSTVDISKTTMVSLGSTTEVNASAKGTIPFNPGSVELAYLLDQDNNVLLAGFISDGRKEISLETTAEVILYYGLDYYLLPPSAKKAFLNNVRQVADFDGWVNNLTTLFASDPLMYSKGTYLDLLNEKLGQISSKNGNSSGNRIFINDVLQKSGITIQNPDSVHVQLQNFFPRRTHAFVYKKLVYDRSGNLTEIPNYSENPMVHFDLKPGKKQQIDAFQVGSQLSQVSTQASIAENASISDPIALPFTGNTEFVAEYELVVVGSGVEKTITRDLSSVEKEAYEALNVKTYILDYFLPTLLDIGGNKDLLPAFGDAKEDALYNAVLPTLEANSTVLDVVKQNKFKEASELFLPELYGNIRLSDDLRNILTDVYNIISNGGSMPNTFVQSQELVETGIQRTEMVMEALYTNMNFGQKTNIKMLNTEANAVESWIIDSINAEVTINPTEADVCLGDPLQIRAGYYTFYEPGVEEFEYHWSTSNKFGGRVQDIEGDPSNYGVSIVTTSNIVSYISAATESELTDGDNFETVEVVVYTKNLQSGQLTEVGRTSMVVNNKKTCISFFAPFEKEVLITTFSSQLLCGGGLVYTVGVPGYIARFKAVKGATSYRGKILKKDGTYGDEFVLSDLEDIGDDMLEFHLGIGPINVLQTCNQAEAEQEQQIKLDNMDTIGHQGIEITPIF
jgi:hypothetical protein